MCVVFQLLLYNSNPTVCRPLVARPGGSMRQYGEQLVAVAGPKQPGRKCLSRTQMSEPYELSQDLLDKQLEMLGSASAPSTPPPTPSSAPTAATA